MSKYSRTGLGNVSTWRKVRDAHCLRQKMLPQAVTEVFNIHRFLRHDGPVGGAAPPWTWGHPPVHRCLNRVRGKLVLLHFLKRWGTLGTSLVYLSSFSSLFWVCKGQIEALIEDPCPSGQPDLPPEAIPAARTFTDYYISCTR
jgi:hypothetical protein